MKVIITGDFGTFEYTIQSRQSTLPTTSAREYVRSVVENGGFWDGDKFFPLHRIDLFEVKK